MKKKTAFVGGAGGFIGGFFVKSLIKKGYAVVTADIKPRHEWYQIHDEAENHFSTSLTDFKMVDTLIHGADEVYNFACNMGGIGFCENNHLMTGLSIEINTNLIKAALKHRPKKMFYSSSACVYNESKQTSTNNPGLKESDAWPAQPDLLYGLEKLFSEQMYKYLHKEHGIEVYITRFHNVYGPKGTWDGGREKAPAAALRKMIKIVKGDADANSIEIWGDGLQTRSFMYIDDCIEGIHKIVNEPKLIATPINLGSDELVTIKYLHDLAADIAGVLPTYKYNLNAPLGVRGRNSDNTFIKQVLNWAPSTPLAEGMKKTYDWMFKDYDDPHSPYRVNHEIRWW